MKKGFTVNQEFLDQYNLSPAARERMIAFIEQAREPKSEETRERMRQAKLGKPKAPEHRAQMSATHRQRQDLRKQIETEHPEYTARQVWARVRELMYDQDQ